MKKLHFGNPMNKANDQLIIDVVMVTQRRPRPQVNSPVALVFIPNQSKRSELTASACSRLLARVECGNTFHIACTLARTSTYPAVSAHTWWDHICGQRVYIQTMQSRTKPGCCVVRASDLNSLTKFPWHDTWFCSNGTLITSNQCG